jgi:sRNA-binding protein
MHDPTPTPADPTPTNAAETAPGADAPTVVQAEAEPAAQPVAEPATEPVAEPTAEPTADPVAATPLDAGDGPAAAPAAQAPRAEPSLADSARLLAEHFPALFGAGVVKPVKLRIQADIQQRAPSVFTKKALSLFLHRHTTGSAYLRALLSAETRFDLDGQPAGEIAPEHKEAARVEVERRRAIVEAKKEAGRAAARAAREAARPPRPPQASAVPGPDGAPRSLRADRPARGPRPGGSASTDRPPRGEGDRRPPRPEGQGWPDQQDRPPRADRPPPP